MGWVWGRGRRGELGPGCSRGGEAAAPPDPPSSHDPFKFAGPCARFGGGTAGRPASVPRFPATARKFRSRTPGALPHPTLPGQSARSVRSPGSGGLRMEETLLHKHQLQVLFSLRAASSLAPAPHRHVMHGSPPFPGRGTEPCPRRLFRNFEKLTR